MKTNLLMRMKILALSLNDKEGFLPESALNSRIQVLYKTLNSIIKKVPTLRACFNGLMTVFY